MNQSYLHLKILVNENQTTLPRCMQILSRRGFILKGLITQSLNNGRATLHCALVGPEIWHGTIPQLLYKNIDVLSVEKVEDDD